MLYSLLVFDSLRIEYADGQRDVRRLDNVREGFDVAANY